MFGEPIYCPLYLGVKWGMEAMARSFLFVNDKLPPNIIWDVLGPARRLSGESNLPAEVLPRAAGIKARDVPYQRDGSTLAGVAGKHVDFVTPYLPPSFPLINGVGNDTFALRFLRKTMLRAEIQSSFIPFRSLQGFLRPHGSMHGELQKV